MYNNQHSELSEDNYGIKETTPLQTCRRGRDLDWLVPHPHVVDKNSGGISSVESQPHTRPPSSASQYQEDKTPQLLAAKNSKD